MSSSRSSSAKAMTFLKNAHLGAFDLVTSYKNTNLFSPLHSIVFSHEISPEDGVHSEKNLYIKKNDAEIRRSDNTFREKTYISANKHT